MKPSKLIALAAACMALPLCASPYRSALSNYEPAVPLREVRALWIVRDSLKTRQSIRAVIESMRRNNFNTALVQVRGRGDALYRSDFVPLAADIEPGLDPLAEFIRLARLDGIAVHAWVNVFLGADMTTRRTAPPNHLIHAHKDWFLKDKTGRSMLTYTRAELKRADAEGAFLDPALPAVREYTLRVMRELLVRYPVAGLHLDYIRYPFSTAGSNFDFGLATARFSAGDQRTDAAAMRDLRSYYVTRMVLEIRAEMRKNFPSRILSAAVWPNRKKIEEHIFQPWPEWLRKNLLDYAFLMAYYDTAEVHDTRIEQFYDPAINSRMIIGVGIYRNPKPQVALHQLRSARAMGAAGVCYFQANWFLSKDSETKEKRYLLPAVFHVWREPGLVPAK